MRDTDVLGNMVKNAQLVNLDRYVQHIFPTKNIFRHRKIFRILLKSFNLIIKVVYLEG